jgi:hypothetical protein
MGVIVEACWKGYKQAGLKKKGDRMVPNCVPITEDINIPINVGDVVLGGKFKNKRIVVKSIDKNEKGDITINGKPLLKFRMVQEGGDVIGICEMGCGPRRKGESEADYKKRCGGYTYAFPLYMTSKKEDEPQEEPTTPPSDSETPAETPSGEVAEAQAVSGSKIHKFITGKNLTLKGKKYADIEFEVVSTDNKSELVKLRVLSPKNLFGQELNVPFKTIRRGPFIKTQTKGVFETIKKVDGKYVVYPKKGGDRLGTHDSYEAALKQLQAIEASKARNEDLRKWFGKGKTGSSGGGGWDRYGSDGQKLGKCGDGDEGDAYAACLSKEKAAKLGPEGRAAFVRRKRADQKKAGDAKKGGEQKKGQKPTFSKTGASESKINEIPMADLQKIDQFADKQLNPLDVVITDKHFFDRLNDPRNGKEISQAELIGFFKRLGKNKKQFLDFLDKYQEMVAVDDRTNINIPFMKQANKAIAKTIMRKKDFKSSTPKLDI